MIKYSSILVESSEDLCLDKFVDLMLVSYVEELGNAKSTIDQNFFHCAEAVVDITRVILLERMPQLHLWDYGLQANTSKIAA